MSDDLRQGESQPTQSDQNLSRLNAPDSRKPNEKGHRDPTQNKAFPREFVHDLRNMLAPIRNAVQLIRLRGASDPSLLSIADMLDRQVDGIGRILENLVSQGESGNGGVVRATPREREFSNRSVASPRVKRILIADDNHSLRLSLGNILEEMGYEVKAAEDGAEALAVARDWMPGCVVLDIHMPKVDGFEVARQLRSQFPATTMTLVMMSGDSLSELTLRAAKLAGFDHCVDKVNSIGLLQQLFDDDA